MNNDNDLNLLMTKCRADFATGADSFLLYSKNIKNYTVSTTIILNNVLNSTD